eukprot:3722305-Amphidinium_carterae.1
MVLEPKHFLKGCALFSTSAPYNVMSTRQIPHHSSLALDSNTGLPIVWFSFMERGDAKELFQPLFPILIRTHAWTTTTKKVEPSYLTCPATP